MSTTTLAEYRLEIRDLMLLQRRSKFWRFTLVISLIAPNGEIYAIAIRGCLLFLTRHREKPLGDLPRLSEKDLPSFFVKPPSVLRDGSLVMNVIEFSKDLSMRIIRMFHSHGLLDELVKETGDPTLRPVPSVEVPEAIIEDQTSSKMSNEVSK